MLIKPLLYSNDSTNQMDRLESFYGSQADNYDSYRQRFLHGKQYLMRVFHDLYFVININ